MKAADLNVELPKLPVDRTYEAAHGKVLEISPLIRRVCAENPMNGTSSVTMIMATSSPTPREWSRRGGAL